MRLGGPVSIPEMTPGAWVDAHREMGYRAALCPCTSDDDTTTVEAFASAARAADILIAEVGAWSNPLSPDPDERARALEQCKTQLALAERVGASCCVNISGSRGQPWDGPHPDNLTPETFDMVVASVREIIDAVKPDTATYALEPMPWMYPHTSDNYLALLEAVDRPAFAVHIDMVNVINSPEKYFANGELIREWFGKLGPRIVSCHAKDTLISTQLTTHLSEVRAGLGHLDYATLLREINKLGPDIPLIIEHLATQEEYALSAAYIRSVAAEVGVPL